MRFLYKLIILEWERAKLFILGVIAFITMSLVVIWGNEWKNASLGIWTNFSSEMLFFGLQLILIFLIILMSAWTWLREWQMRSHFIDRLMLIPVKRFYLFLAKWVFQLGVISLFVSVQHLLGIAYYLMLKLFFPILSNNVYFSPSRILNSSEIFFQLILPTNPFSFAQYILFMSGVVLTIMNSVIIYRSLYSGYRIWGIVASICFLIGVPFLLFLSVVYIIGEYNATAFFVLEILGNALLLLAGYRLTQRHLSV
ncbi:hypothetical protein [Atopobacter phocae]|uniref:hypothetical protein n=1 Tax=Atopobacter phocae TaxID=136492 RepID=UPI000471CF07|nr:hypothetical protein [Atopobacter phocae]